MMQTLLTPPSPVHEPPGMLCRLGPADLPALRRLTGPDLPAHWPPLHLAVEHGSLLAECDADGEVRAATALLPLYLDTPLTTSLRAAGYAMDGQGAVLTPPVVAEDYGALRPFLYRALHRAVQRYASYHIWVVLAPDPAAPAECEYLCAQYLAAGLTLRGIRAMDGCAGMMIFSAHSTPQQRQPCRRLACSDPALPWVLERGYTAAEYGWNEQGMQLLLRPVAQGELPPRCMVRGQFQRDEKGLLWAAMSLGGTAGNCHGSSGRLWQA